MSFLGTRNAVAIGVSQHLTLGGPDLLSKLSPSLILQFAGAQTMDPRITFTRSTTATFTGSNGLLQTAAIDAPRFDYNPVTRAPLGLLIEEQRTNTIRNNTMQGAVAGTPGTLPTNWTSFTSLTGLTRQVVGAGIEDGINYIDIRISGTPSAGGSFNFFTETSTAVAALSGQNWTNSAYFKLQAGSLTGITATRLYFQENNIGGGYLTEQNTTVTEPTGASLAAQRFTASRTLSNASTAFVMPGFNLLLSGAAIDITLRIGLPQLELGAFATSVIPTVASQVTRAADVAVMTGTNFSDWYNQTAGTIYAEAALVSNSGNRVYLDVGPNGAFGTTAYIVQTSSAISLAPAAAPVNMVSSVNTTSLNNKVAAALETNNSLVAANGALGTVDTNCAMPVSATQLVIGNAVWSGGGTQLNGHIRRIAYYPRRLSNAALQGITS